MTPPVEIIRGFRRKICRPAAACLVFRPRPLCPSVLSATLAWKSSLRVFKMPLHRCLQELVGYYDLATEGGTLVASSG